MGLSRREYSRHTESYLISMVFKEALALAEEYEYPHCVWRAINNMGVNDTSERIKLFREVGRLIHEQIDLESDPAARSDSWRPGDIFSEEGREWLIEQARKHLLEYPDPEEYSND